MREPVNVINMSKRKKRQKNPWLCGSPLKDVYIYTPFVKMSTVQLSQFTRYSLETNQHTEWQKRSLSNRIPFIPFGYGAIKTNLHQSHLDLDDARSCRRIVLHCGLLSHMNLMSQTNTAMKWYLYKISHCLNEPLLYNYSWLRLRKVFTRSLQVITLSAESTQFTTNTAHLSSTLAGHR